MKSFIIVISIALLLILASFSNGSSLISVEEKQQKIIASLEAINKTTSINNNKTCNTNISENEPESWMDFSMQEYDLMDYLQNLSAKYKNVVLSPSDEYLNLQQDSKLEAKHEVSRKDVKQDQSTTPTSISSSTSTTTTTADKLIEDKEITATSLASDMSLADHEIAESSWQYGIFDRFTRARSTTTTTPAPDPRFTFEPNAKIDMRLFNSDECGLRTYNQRNPIELTGHVVDQLLGIGDRPLFAPSPMLISESEHKPVTSAQSNSDSSVAAAAAGPSAASEALENPANQETAIKELHHRRQRPSTLLQNGPNSIADLIRWQQMESIYGNKQLAAAASASASAANGELSSTSNDNSKISNWPNKDEKDNYDNYKSHLGAILQKVPMNIANQQQAAGSSSSNDEDFNLLARRNWLQQQIGNTLQMFAPLNFTQFNNNNNNNNNNNSNNNQYNYSELLFPLNQINYSNLSLSREEASLSNRENMMKKFGNLRSAKKSENFNGDLSMSPGGATNLQNKNKTMQKLIPSVTSISDAVEKIINDSTNQLKARQDELKLEPRVIGGNDARLGDSPWSVSLQALVSRPGTGQVEYRHYCGGTIISEHYILTAAHCLDFMVGRESRLFVVIGDLNWRMSTASQYGRRFAIDKLLIHGGYKNTAFGHDIGLIRTKEPMKPLKVNGRYIINSVCLPERGVEHQGEAELVGWGLFSNRNEMADSLQIAEVPILPRPLCVDLYRRRTGLIQWLIGIELITDKQVCAGTFGRGICQGDSGSALVYNEKIANYLHQSSSNTNSGPFLRRSTDDSRATIIGIVAFGGIRRCSYQSLPGVYMQTSKYLDWILPRIQV